MLVRIIACVLRATKFFHTGITNISHCPPGLEILANLTKLYLIKRIEMVQSDPIGAYKAEVINEEGNRIFVIRNATHYNSDEQITYGKYKRLKMKGKICFGVINYAGLQVFEIYGDPEKVIRIGPNSSVWGEIQVIPGPVWDSVPIFYCCCCCNAKRKALEDQDAEIRVVILKKDLGEKHGPFHPTSPSFKHVYTLRGKVYGGCCNKEQDNVLYKKSFDLQIYSSDPLAAENEVAAQAGHKDAGPDISKRLLRDKKLSFEPQGRLSSSEHHEKLNCELPSLEIPQSMDVYDKITLMGTFFLFSLT